MHIKITNIIYALYSMLIYLVYVLSTGILPPSIKWTANKAWYLVTFVLLVLVLYKSRAKMDKSSFIPVFLLGMYTIFAVVSYSLTLNFSEAAAKILPTLIYLLTFFIIIRLVTLLPLYQIIKPFIFSSIVMIFLSVIMYFGYDIPIYGEEVITYGSAVDYVNAQAFASVFLNKNTFGGTLVVAIVSLYAGILIARSSSLYKNTLYLCIFISVILLITTLSRASIFAILIVGFLFAFKNITNKSGFYMLVAAAIALVCLYLYFSSYIDEFLERVETDGTSSRTLIWEDALSTFYAHPFTGVGNYHFKIYTKEFVTHNSYLGQLVNLGIFPSLFWFLWLIYGLFYTSKYLFSFNKVPRVNSFFTSYFVAILVYNFVEEALPSATFPMTLLFMVAFSYNIYTYKLNKSSI